LVTKIIEQMYTDPALKYLDFLLVVFCTSENVISFMDRKVAYTHRWAAIRQSNMLTLRCLAGHIIATNMLLITRES